MSQLPQLERRAGLKASSTGHAKEKSSRQGRPPGVALCDSILPRKDQTKTHAAPTQLLLRPLLPIADLLPFFHIVTYFPMFLPVALIPKGTPGHTLTSGKRMCLSAHSIILPVRLCKLPFLIPWHFLIFYPHYYILLTDYMIFQRTDVPHADA